MRCICCTTPSEDTLLLQTILSQDVSLFSGTIQSNLDPLGHCTQEECMVVLKRCHLTTILNHTPTADEPTILDMRVNHGSLSAGEKQLLAVARATLRRTNVIILDEATSQVDSLLDDQVSIRLSHFTRLCLWMEWTDPKDDSRRTI